MRRLIAITIAALVFGALSGVAAYQKVRPQASAGERHWQEIAWPYPRDGWPAGRAFRCDGCVGGIELYVRPKIGFCNCDSGVADDDEVDRVADLDLISERFAPLAPGKVIRVADLSGRSRAYDLDMPRRRPPRRGRDRRLASLRPPGGRGAGQRARRRAAAGGVGVFDDRGDEALDDGRAGWGVVAP